MNNLDYKENYSSNKAFEMICDQHIDKLSSNEIETLKLLDWSSLLNLSLVNRSCNNQLFKLIKYKNPEVEKFIDLRLFANIQKCVSANLKEPNFVNQAIKIAQIFYEASYRPIKNSNYGLCFPINPELLYYSMFLARNETVLEIAGASGANAALLAFSGAKKVYMNDIVPEEIAIFKNLSAQLPAQLQNIVEPVLGNCFDLFKLKPELNGNVGLLLCNNFIHFLNDKEQENFFDLLKKILKPGGRAILTANSSYTFSENKEMYERYPDNTTWKNTVCFVQDYSQGTMPVDQIFTNSSKSDPSEVSTNYQQCYLWLKDKTTSYRWVENRSGYETLLPEVAENLQQVIKKKFHKIENILCGSLRLLNSTFHLFQERNFSELFKNNGFIVEQTFLISANGHLFFGEDPYGKANKVGIVIKAPNINKT